MLDYIARGLTPKSSGVAEKWFNHVVNVKVEVLMLLKLISRGCLEDIYRGLLSERQRSGVPCERRTKRVTPFVCHATPKQQRQQEQLIMTPNSKCHFHSSNLSSFLRANVGENAVLWAGLCFRSSDTLTGGGGGRGGGGGWEGESGGGGWASGAQSTDLYSQRSRTPARTTPTLFLRSLATVQPGRSRRTSWCTSTTAGWRTLNGSRTSPWMWTTKWPSCGTGRYFVETRYFAWRSTVQLKWRIKGWLWECKNVMVLFLSWCRRGPENGWQSELARVGSGFWWLFPKLRNSRSSVLVFSPQLSSFSLSDWSKTVVNGSPDNDADARNQSDCETFVDISHALHCNAAEISWIVNLLIFWWISTGLPWCGLLFTKIIFTTIAGNLAMWRVEASWKILSPDYGADDSNSCLLAFTF